MKSGGFEAIGQEYESFRDWRLDVGTLGIVQFFVYLSLWLFELVPRVELGFAVSFLILLGSVILLGLLRYRQKLGTYKVQWKDNRDAPGLLELSYTGPNGKVRTGMIVDKVEAYPDRPLWHHPPGRGPALPVEGTNASLMVFFKNTKKFGLGLGFDNAEQMNRIYDQLK